MATTARKKAAPKQLTTAQRLDSIIKSARKIMRKDKGLNGDLDRLPMLTWIMFLKFLDDMERIEEGRAELAGKDYRSIIEAPYRWRDWAADADGITGPDLLSFLVAEMTERPDGTRGPGLFAYLRALRGDNGRRERRDVIATVFQGFTNRMESGYLLRDVVNLIDGIHFDSSEEVHVLGRLYETLLREMRDAAGDSGEFYTPRPVVQFMVEVTDPQLGETILDPACGTGGFLTEAFLHLEKQADTVEKRRILQEESIIGGEAKSLPFLLSQLNLLLHGLHAPRIDPGNALRFRLNEIGEAERVNVILTNPPFGGEEETGILNNFPDDRRTAETALLFLQLIMRRLKRAGRGRAAVVVPNGTLYGDGIAARVKADLLEQFNLHTVVRLCEGVFAPYTDIPANLIFFDTSGPTRDIWYYEQPRPEGRKKYSKTAPMAYEEFAGCLAWWNDREVNERAWKVSGPDLIQRDEQCRVLACNLDLKNPHAAEAEDHRAPAEIVEAIIARERDVLSILDELRAEVAGGTVKKWPRVPLSEVLGEVSEPVSVDPAAQYPNLGLFSYARGAFLKPPIDGAQTSAKTLYRVRAGQLIYSRLFAFEGAYAVVPNEMDGFFVSNEYPVFDHDPDRVDVGYLRWLLTEPEVWREIAVGSKGLGVRRQRVHPVQVLGYRAPLPPLDEQRRIVAQLERMASLVEAQQQGLDIAGALIRATRHQVFGAGARSA